MLVGETPGEKEDETGFAFQGDVGKLLKKMFKSKNIDIFLSLSDEKKYSIAFVIIKK